MVSINETNAVQLTELLEDAAQSLVRLHAVADRVRRTAPWAPRGLLPFSANALDRLCSLVREGHDATIRRLTELSADSDAKALASDTDSSSDTPAQRAAPTDPQSLIAAYRDTARALGASIVQAQRLSDARSAAVLSALLHRLEKQLWLLDSESRPRVGLPTINLFLSC